MPQMGESIAEGTLSRWLKKVGDEVKRDEPIFEISTDKVDAEIPAPTAGVLAEILVKEGQTVPVQTVVARMETEKGAAVGAAPSAAPAPEARAPEKAAAPSAAAPAAAPARPGGGAGGPPRGQSTPAPSPTPQPSAAPRTPIAQPNGGNSYEERLRTKSSPLVRKIAAEHGIELSDLQGTGVAGRVTKRDILEFIESGQPAAAATRPSPYAPAGVEQHAPAPASMPGDVVEPMTQIRRITSDHMVLARRTASHVTTFHEIDLTRVARLRNKARAAFEASTGQKLTYLPFVIKVVTEGLKQHPVLNAAVSGTNIVYRKQYNIGIAVALDWGLIVPVIKNADDLSLTGLTRQLNDLAQRARTKRLQPQEVQGATFSITNFGVFGSLMGTPIIPVNTSAILGLGAIEKRPKVLPGVDGEDTIAIRTCAYFSLSFDHRIVDGADADKFLSFIKQGLETFPEAGIT
jgi:2-oxoglutarate dehydrogenase E2 component (dihydrolipoamide succinyltransferase)